MRAIFGILFFFLSVFSFGAQYKAGDLFEIDFDSGWNEAKSNDPQVVLRLEKGHDFIEFSKLEDELSDYYLKSKLKEQIESFSNQGKNVSDLKTSTIHGVSTAYYAISQENIISFLTYSGVSYAIMAKGVSESKFRDITYFFRKPGEKVEKPKIKPARRKKAKIEKEEEPIEHLTQYISIADDTFSFSTQTASLASETTTEVKAEAQANINTQISTSIPQTSSSDEIENKVIDAIVNLASKSYSSKPLLSRKPLPKLLMITLIALWFLLWLILSSKYCSIPNPKMKPYPQDVPPDFFFPFIISRVKTSKETMFHIITRQKQVLSGFYNHEFQPIISLGIYGLIFFHILWSLSGFINENLFTGFLASLPMGKYIASIPELPFIILVVWGLIKKKNTKQILSIIDAQTNPVISILPDKKYYAMMKDGKGKEVAQLHKRGDYFNRKWHFVDTDNQVVFTIVDEYPQIYKVIKFLGNPTGSMRCRYSIFVDDKRAGFLYVDMNSKDGYQVHIEYDFARLAPPAQIMASLLYISNREKEKSFLNL